MRRYQAGWFIRRLDLATDPTAPQTNIGHKFGIGWQIIIVMIIFYFLIIPRAFAQNPLTAEVLIESTFQEDHQKALEKGEIVLVSRPEEVANTELNVLMAVLVPSALNDTIAELQYQASEKQTPDVLEIQEIKIAQASPQLSNAFKGVTFDPTENGEAEVLLQKNPGKDYNLSAEEIELFKTAANKRSANASDIDTAAVTLRVILKQRYLSYRHQGLLGIPGYKISANSQVSPSDELIAATDSLLLLKNRYPGYYQCLRFYPECEAPYISHQFFWVKQEESGRPMFVLKHWFMDIQPNYGLITERHYYLSHSLNSLQVVIGCLPHGDHTLVVLFNQVFTEKVNVTVGKRIAKKVGLSIVEKKVRPIFENLRSVFSKQP